MSLLDTIAGAGKAARTLSTVVDYVASVEKHTNKSTGVTGYGLKIAPVLSDGNIGRFGDMWIRLDSPDAARAFAKALPKIAASINALDAKLVEAGEWVAGPKPAAPAKPKAAAAPPSAPAAPAAPASVLDGLELPF